MLEKFVRFFGRKSSLWECLCRTAVNPRASELLNQKLMEFFCNREFFLKFFQKVFFPNALRNPEFVVISSRFQYRIQMQENHRSAWLCTLDMYSGYTLDGIQTVQHLKHHNLVEDSSVGEPSSRQAHGMRYCRFEINPFVAIPNSRVTRAIKARKNVTNSIFSC